MMVIKMAMCNAYAPYAIAILKAALAMMYYHLVVLLNGCGDITEIACCITSAFVLLEQPSLEQNDLTKSVDSVAISAHNDLNE